MQKLIFAGGHHDMPAYENKHIFACRPLTGLPKKVQRPPSTLENLTGHLSLSCFLLILSLPHSSTPALPLLSSLSQPSLSLSWLQWLRSGGDGNGGDRDDDDDDRVGLSASLADPPLASLERSGSDGGGARGGESDSGGQET